MILELENICFERDNKKILNNINLTIDLGKFIAITGPNGSGKSTLVKMIMGIEKPDSGKIIFDGKDITNINRQIIALHSTLGRKKVDVMKERIVDINPNCQVEIYDCFLSDDFSLIESCSFDFFVDCCDTVSTKENVISYCLKQHYDFLVCLGTAKKFDPSLLEITELSKTYNDPLARILRKYVKDNSIHGQIPVLFSSELPCNVQQLGSTAFVPSSAGLLIASYIVRKFINDIEEDG